MGIAKAAVKFLLKESTQRPFHGTVLQLGKQGVWVTYKQLQEIAKEFSFQLTDPGEISLSHNPEGKKRGCINDLCLFKSLGFSSCKSLDCSPYEGADYIFDLNSQEVPEEMRGQFDVIVDGGTVEHVFHLPNALKNIFVMLRPGGRIIHLTPASNHIDHGFYMFSPSLFWEFYRVNQFKIHSMDLIRYTIQHDTKPWDIYAYQPGCLEPVSLGGLDNKLYGMCCVVEKTALSTGHIIPKQVKYDSAQCTNIRFSKTKRWGAFLRKLFAGGYGLELTARY